MQRRQGLSRAFSGVDLQGAVESGEAQLLGAGTGVVVLAHPPDKLAVARLRPPPVAEAPFHGLVEGARTRGDVVVDDEAAQTVTLDGDRPVALVVDELPEELVPQVEQRALTVGGLAEGEQSRAVWQQRHDCGGGDGVGGICECSSHSVNGIVEPAVETF